MIEKLYTVEEVAELASVTGRTIRNYLKSGRLVGRKIGGQWRFPEAEVQRLLNGAPPEPATAEIPETPEMGEAAPQQALPMQEAPVQPAWREATPANANTEYFPVPAQHQYDTIDDYGMEEDEEESWASPAPQPEAPAPAQEQYAQPAPLPNFAPGQPAPERPAPQPVYASPAYEPPVYEQPVYTAPAAPPQEAPPQQSPPSSYATYEQPPVYAQQPLAGPQPMPVQPVAGTASPAQSGAQAPRPEAQASVYMPPVYPVQPAMPQPPEQAPAAYPVPYGDMQQMYPGIPMYPYPFVQPVYGAPPVAAPAAPPEPQAPAEALTTALVAEPPIQAPAPQAAPAQSMEHTEPQPAAEAPPAAPAAPVQEAASAQSTQEDAPQLSDVGSKVTRFMAEVHDCAQGPQLCAVIDLHQSLASARLTSERLADIADEESEDGVLCQSFVEYDERFFVARYTLFGTSSFLLRCLKLIG